MTIGREKTDQFELVTRHLSLSYGSGFLAFASAQVIQLGAADAAFFFHFDFGNPR